MDIWHRLFSASCLTSSVTALKQNQSTDHEHSQLMLDLDHYWRLAHRFGRLIYSDIRRLEAVQRRFTKKLVRLHALTYNYDVITHESKSGCGL